MFVSIKNY